MIFLGYQAVTKIFSNKSVFQKQSNAAIGSADNISIAVPGGGVPSLSGGYLVWGGAHHSICYFAEKVGTPAAAACRGLGGHTSHDRAFAIQQRALTGGSAERHLPEAHAVAI